MALGDLTSLLMVGTAVTTPGWAPEPAKAGDDSPSQALSLLPRVSVFFFFWLHHAV